MLIYRCDASGNLTALTSSIPSIPQIIAHPLEQAVMVGGVASFSFAELPQSPLRYRPERAPPPHPAGWEWHVGI